MVISQSVNQFLHIFILLTFVKLIYGNKVLQQCDFVSVCFSETATRVGNVGRQSERNLLGWQPDHHFIDFFTLFLW